MDLRPSAQAIEALSDSQLEEWIFQLCMGEDDELLELGGEFHPALRMQRLYDVSSPRLQRRIHRSVVANLAEWRRRAHGWEVLNNLVRTAALLRIRSSATMLKVIADREKLIYAGQSPFEMADAVVGTLAGFAPDEVTFPILESIFFDPDLDARLSGVLLHGLCVCAVVDFPRYLRRYIDCASRTSGYFPEPYVNVRFVQLIKPPVIARNWSFLDDESRAFILKGIGDAPDEEFRLGLHEGGPVIEWRKGNRITSTPLPEEISNFALAYKNQRTQQVLTRY